VDSSAAKYIDGLTVGSNVKVYVVANDGDDDVHKFEGASDENTIKASTSSGFDINKGIKTDDAG
jgi:hypothetical protein